MVYFFLLPAVKKTPFLVQLEKFSILPILKRFTKLNLDASGYPSRLCIKREKILGIRFCIWQKDVILNQLFMDGPAACTALNYKAKPVIKRQL